MQQVDVLLMLHGDTAECPEYIPSKLYEYFWARRPVLAITHRNPQLDALVRAHDGTLAASTDPAGFEAALETLVERWLGADLPDVAIPPVTTADSVRHILEAVDAHV